MPSSNSSANDATTLLDALDGVLQSFARFPLATESLDAESATAKITDWMRHATTGTKHPPRAARA